MRIGNVDIVFEGSTPDRHSVETTVTVAGGCGCSTSRLETVWIGNPKYQIYVCKECEDSIGDWIVAETVKAVRDGRYQ